MVSTRPLITKSPRLYTNPLVAVSNAPIAIGITISFLFHSFFSSLARSKYLSHFLFPSVLSCGQPEKSPLFGKIFFFTVTRFGRLAKIRLPICILKSKEFWASHFLRWILSWEYTICSYGQIQTISSGSPCLLCRVYSYTLFCTKLLHSIIIIIIIGFFYPSFPIVDIIE